MLTITVGATQSFDESTSSFVEVGGTPLVLEHSLVSVAAWESKWESAFLGPDPKTSDQLIDYIKIMTLNDVPEDVYAQLSEENVMAINEYIGKKMTATTIPNEPAAKGETEVITAELIYYWMVAHNIDFQCQYWHINRLLMLVRVLNFKNAASDKNPKKITGDDLARRRAENARRRAEAQTSG